MFGVLFPSSVIGHFLFRPGPAQASRLTPSPNLASAN